MSERNKANNVLGVMISILAYIGAAALIYEVGKVVVVIIKGMS